MKKRGISEAHQRSRDEMARSYRFLHQKNPGAARILFLRMQAAHKVFAKAWETAILGPRGV